MKHKDKQGAVDSYEDKSSEASESCMPSSMDPAGTKLHFKLSEIVMRPKKQSSPTKRTRQGAVAVEEEKEESEIKLFYSLSDGGDQFFNSV